MIFEYLQFLLLSLYKNSVSIEVIMSVIINQYYLYSCYPAYNVYVIVKHIHLNLSLGC